MLISYKVLCRPVPISRAVVDKLGSEWVAQRKVDGVRVMIESDGVFIRGVSRHGIVMQVPTVVRDALREYGRKIVLDGELDGDGYSVFDVIVDGEVFEDRIERLRHHPLSRLRVLPTMSVAEGIRMGMKQGWEGLVIKGKRAMYPGRPGGEADKWLKLLFNQDVIV